MERAGEVLPRRKVHGRLAAEGAVGGREERRRRLDDGHAAQRERRREARHVADRSASERDDAPVAPEPAPRRAPRGGGRGRPRSWRLRRPGRRAALGSRTRSAPPADSAAPCRSKTGLEETRNQRPGAMRREALRRASASAPGPTTTSVRDAGRANESEKPLRHAAPTVRTSSRRLSAPSAASRARCRARRAARATRGPGDSVMRSVPEAVFGNAITSRIEDEPVRIMSMRSRPSAMPPCGGAPKRNASSRKPNFARASSGSDAERARRRATARRAGGSGSTRRPAPSRSGRRRRRAPSRGPGRSRETAGPPRAAT